MSAFPSKIVGTLREAAKAANSAGDEVLELPRNVLRQAAGYRLLVPICIAAGVACIAVAEFGNERLSAVFTRIQASYELRRELLTLGALTVDAETAQRGYLLTSKLEYLEPYLSAYPKMPRVIQHIRELSAGDEQYLAVVDSIQQGIDDKLAELRATIVLLETGREKEAFQILDTNKGKEISDRIRAELNRLLNLEQTRTDAYVSRWRDDLRFQRFAVSFSVALSVILVLVLLRSVRRELELERNQNARLDLVVRERTEELSELASHLQSAREEETARLARELHDELGAIFTASRMDLAWVRRKLPDMPPEIMTKLLRTQELLDQGVALKRRIIEGLVPSALINLGLIPALESLIEEFGHRTGVTTQIDLTDEPLFLSRDQSIAIFRIVQEALTNIERHARANHIALSLQCEEARLEVCVRDDGCGMENTNIRHIKSHGLRGMKQRVAALRGEFTMRSTPGKGTEIAVSLPINMEATVVS